MTDRPNRSALYAGIFVLSGLVLLGWLILEFGPLRHKLRRPYRIYATFMDAQNLVKGAPVKRAGANIGEVATAPELVEGMKGVRVALEIYPEYRIPENSPFRILPIGLMGDTMVDIGVDPAPTGEFLAEGASVDGTSSGDLQSAANRITDEALVVMKDIRSGLRELNTTLGKLNSGVLSDANLKNLAGSMQGLNAAIEKVDKQVLSPENTTALTDAVRTFRETMEAARGAAGHADSGMAKMDSAFDKLDPGLSGVTDATASLRDAADALQELVKDARTGDGLLFALLNDGELKTDFARLIANLRDRGILFYKDKPEGVAPPERKTLKPWGKR